MENPTLTVDKSLGRVRGQGMRQGMRASVALRQLDIPSLHLVAGSGDPLGDRYGSFVVWAKIQPKNLSTGLVNVG